MTQTQQTESAERIARPLIQLAKLNGISNVVYRPAWHLCGNPRRKCCLRIGRTSGVDASSDEAITASYAATQQRIADTIC